jgi:DNA-binding transcriptional regulator LsrR (DeoR family)
VHQSPSLDASAPASHVRLLARVARMYYERDLTQQQIADQLGLSQARVSRLLKEAGERGIVRSIVVIPDGVHTDLEEALERRFGLMDAVVVDTAGASDIGRALGVAAAAYLDVALAGADVVGVSSWSGSLVAAVEAMRPRAQAGASLVVQMFGGVGDPAVQMQATRLTGRLAEVLRAQPLYVPSPALVGSKRTRTAMMADPAMEPVVAAWERMGVCLVGIGTLEPSPLLRSSGNAVSEEQADELRSAGAVGDICLRYFDAAGRHVASAVDERLLGMSEAAIRAVPRRIAVAGGEGKQAAIRAALLGGWVSTLITDAESAAALVSS